MSNIIKLLISWIISLHQSLKFLPRLYDLPWMIYSSYWNLPTKISALVYWHLKTVTPNHFGVTYLKWTCSLEKCTYYLYMHLVFEYQIWETRNPGFEEKDSPDFLQIIKICVIVDSIIAHWSMWNKHSPFSTW